MVPGEIISSNKVVELNQGKKVFPVLVANLGDRPIQVGSHFHFFEVNKALRFKRSDAFGKRLNIPAGTAVRFEPGEEKTVELIEIGGTQIIIGFNNLANGVTNINSLDQAMDNALNKGFVKQGDR